MQDNLEGSFAGKDLWVLVDKLNVSQQRALTATRLTVSWAARG